MRYTQQNEQSEDFVDACRVLLFPVSIQGKFVAWSMYIISPFLLIEPDWWGGMPSASRAQEEETYLLLAAGTSGQESSQECAGANQAE